MPGESVTTFLVTGVSGVAKDAALIQPGHTYQVQGVQSGRSLAPSTAGTGVVIRTPNPASADQSWSIRKVTTGLTHRERYALVNAGTKKRLAVRGGNTVLEANGPDDPAAQWVMSTTGDGSYTFVNVADRRVLDVGGAATGDGSAVGTWLPSSGENQRWRVLDETLTGADQVTAYTVPWRAPVLPTTVTGVYRSGVRATLPVSWQMPAAKAWRKSGTVTVRGTATDPKNQTIAVAAVVAVDTFLWSLPAQAKTYLGGEPELPATVIGVGAHGGRAELPVRWNAPPAGAFDRLGAVQLQAAPRRSSTAARYRPRSRCR